VPGIFLPKKVWENDAKKLCHSMPCDIEYNSAMECNSA
jgi:hypothetical protein